MVNVDNLEAFFKTVPKWCTKFVILFASDGLDLKQRYANNNTAKY